MSKWNGKELTIGSLKASTPIIQGGMGVGVSLSGLASAVANEGGIGVISTAMIGMNEPDFYKNPREANIRALRNEIRRARKLSNGIIGVNIMKVLGDYEDMVKVSIEEGIDIIFVGAGPATDLPSFLNKNSNTKLVPIVSSARAATIITKRWLKSFNYIPDVFVVEGPKAGGHLGFSLDQINNPDYDLEILIIETLKAMDDLKEITGKDIPVIAAGGIFDGYDIHNFLQLGAAGVQMGTRFVTTIECDAVHAFKETYLKANKGDIVIIKSPVGLPGRAIRNAFIDNFEQEMLLDESKRLKCLYHCITSCNPKTSPFCIAEALINAQKGDLKNGFAFAGSNAHLINKITTVRKLIKRLAAEYNIAVRDTNKNIKIKEIKKW